MEVKMGVTLSFNPYSVLLSLHKSILILWLDLKCIVWLSFLNFWASSLMRWEDFLGSPPSILTWTFKFFKYFQRGENENGTIRGYLLTMRKGWWMRQWRIIAQYLKQQQQKSTVQWIQYKFLKYIFTYFEKSPHMWA